MGADSTLRRLAPSIVGFALPFGLVFYLAMRGGGYDVLVRDEVATVIWLAVMICAVTGILMLARLESWAWIALGLLAGLTVWVALATLWSESAERSVEELGRLATYLGAFVLALAIQGRKDGMRRTLFGVAAAIGLVGALAAVSRMHPAWFPDTGAAAATNPDALRLNYPLDYWNGLGSFLAMGIPLLISVALDARNAAARIVATAAVPLVALAIFLTYSRGAWLVAALAVVVFLTVYPRRMRAAPLLALIAGASGALVFAAELRDDLKNGLDTPIARDQGDELLLIAIAVCAVVVGLRIWLERAERDGFELQAPPVSRRVALGVGAAVCAAVVIGLAASGVIGDAWDQFKQPSSAGTGSERLTSAASNGRIEYWAAALDAGASAPLTGIGPGAWDLWWAREATIGGFTRDAHSLYLETFAEIGLVGLILLVGFVGVVLFAGGSRARWALDDERALLAAGLGSAAAFAVAMGLDWGWEIAALPVAFLLVAAALLGPEEETGASTPGTGEMKVTPVARVGLVLAGVLALLVVVPAMQATRAIDASEAARDAGDPERALDEADTAEDLQPYAITPHLLRVPALQDQGDLDGAAAAAAEATETEPTNWRGWFLLAIVERERGDLPAAEAAFAEAVALNPQSTNVLVADPSPGVPPADPQ